MNITENRMIRHRNVASKRYSFVPAEIGLAFEDFRTILQPHGANVDGRLFFTMLNEPIAEVMTAELHMGIKEDDLTIPAEEEVIFRSYFEVKGLAKIRLMDDFDEQSQVAYWALYDHVKKGNLQQKTPVFVEYKQAPDGNTYVEMSVGVSG